MDNNVVKETLKITCVEDLHAAIQNFDTQYGLEESSVVFSDGLPLVCVTLLQTKLPDGETTTQLILSDELPDHPIKRPYPNDLQ